MRPPSRRATPVATWAPTRCHTITPLCRNQRFLTLECQRGTEFDSHDATAAESDARKLTVDRQDKEIVRLKRALGAKVNNASKWKEKYLAQTRNIQQATALGGERLEAAEREIKRAAAVHRREVERLYSDMADLQSNLTASWANEEGLKGRLQS